MTQEAELLLSCARSRVGSQKIGSIREQLQRGLDWEELIRLAKRHGMNPFLYQALHQACPEAVPISVLERVRRRFEENAYRNLLLTAELLRISKLLEGNGIQVLAYKGPLLAVVVYGDLALREFMDLDLLIRPGEVQKAVELLLSDGYRDTLPWRGKRLAANLRLTYHHQLLRNDGKVCLELHWKLTTEPLFLSFDYESLWRQARPVSLGGAEVLAPCPEDLLSTLCVHGAKHLWGRLEWILGLAELIRVPGRIDWAKVLGRIKTRGGARVHWVGLGLAHDLLGIQLPESVLHGLQADPTVSPLIRRIRPGIFQKATQSKGIPIREIRIFLRMTEGIQGKSLFLCRLGLVWIVPTEEEWKLLPLSDRFFPLYYLFRPLRLVVKYGVKLWRFLWMGRRVEPDPP